MKDFVKYICCILGPVFIYGLLNIYILTHPNTEHVKTDTVVFGPSTGAYSLNDSILTDYTNLCVDGIRLWYQQEYISDTIEHNPNIKKVILCFDPMTYNDTYNKDYDNRADSFYRYLRHCARFSEYRLFKKYSLRQILIIAFNVNNFFNIEPHIHGFKEAEEEHLEKNLRTLEANPYYVDKPLKETKMTHGVEQQALRNIIAFCQAKNITVVIYQAPMYQLKRWYGRKGYEEFLSTLPLSILISEYSDFEFPSDNYYRDVRHLNSKGSNYFSNHIKEHGLKEEALEEYLARKKRERGE